MANRYSHHASLTALILLMNLLAGASAIFFIVETDSTVMYLCGADGVECCAAQAPLYEIYSGTGVPGPNSNCGIDAKYEATAGTGRLGSCTYGDYEGFGNVWVYCDKGDGTGLLLLQSISAWKQCVTLPNDPSTYQISDCIGFPTCGSDSTVVVACYDDTWHSVSLLPVLGKQHILLTDC
jgi:hypothetical protein